MSPFFRGDAQPTGEEAALLTMPAEFTWLRMYGMKAYRGLFTDRYTYVRNTDGPWLLYEREADPWQMRNLIGDPGHADVQALLEADMQRRLDRQGDEFLDGRRYLERDGLFHYGEANYELREPWVDPWRGEGVRGRA